MAGQQTSIRYNPQDHIHKLDLTPRTQGVLDQRELTIQAYQTTLTFDFAKLDEVMKGAWLTPQRRLGVFSRCTTNGSSALSVVLGLQDDLKIRAYDYDERRPLWYSWQDAVVDTVYVRYFKDESGLLRFTTTGGGRRITEDRLYEFNSSLLSIPKAAVSKRQFDLARIRELCFSRFADRLYMIRFSDPSGEEYRSIDHALFQSRQYIDADAERLKEVRADSLVKIESFDSDIEVFHDELSAAINVRFFIRGLSGSLRLRFPKIRYKSQLKTEEEHTRVFYRVADATVKTILEDDYYYMHERRSLDELSIDLGMFPDMVDPTPFREVLTSAEERSRFFRELDLGKAWQHWRPHLQAIDELIASEEVASDIRRILSEMLSCEPGLSQQLLSECLPDAKMHRLGALVAGMLADSYQSLPAQQRGQAEAVLLAWAIEREQDSWDVDSETGHFGALNLRWQIDDIAFDAFPAILWKLVGVLHARLMSASSGTASLLSKYHWCMAAAKELPVHHGKNPAALRLVAADCIPRTPDEASSILKSPVSSFNALDESILDQFGLPLWPLLTVSRVDGTLQIANEGTGAAIAFMVKTNEVDAPINGVDLAAGQVQQTDVASDDPTINVEFQKFGQTYCLELPVENRELKTVRIESIPSLPQVINRKRLADQRKYRESIDPTGIVIGSSPALLEVFEHIHHANLMDAPPPVLLLGEPGVGKTHIARLIHESSDRASKEFKVVNAGSGGGDLNIQRGEWVGYSKGHGIQGIDKTGRPGHLMNAHGGTLFVDEFASLSYELQVIFLSVLDKRCIEKVGGDSFQPDVRCVFATNADLEQAVEAGAVRRDLLDRIPVTFTIPSLRERKGDILAIAKHFAGARQFSDRSLLAILRHEWPGNIRELQNEMARSVARIKSDGVSIIEVTHLSLPKEVISAIDQMDNDGVRSSLWSIGDEIARSEGFEMGSGLQRRTGEIMGVGEPQASKMYQALGLGRQASA